MIAAFRYELRRMATLRSARRTPAIAVVLAAALGMAAALGVSADLTPQATAALRLAAAVPILVASVLLGGACSGHERHHGMRTVTLAVVPRRARLAIAKITLTAMQTALLGLAGSLAATGLYGVALAWAYAGDRTLIPADAAAGPITAGLAPAAAAATAAGLFGLAVGWLAASYRTAVVLAAATAALAMPLAAGWLVKVPGVANALGTAEDAFRKTPVLSGLLNPSVLSAWPDFPDHSTNPSPMPPTSLATTALLAGVALIALAIGAFRWQRD